MPLLLALAAAQLPDAPRPAAVASAAAVIARLPDCAANSLSVGTDGLDGYFSGMQKGGTLLVVRNIGPDACKIGGLPALVMKDKAGKVLPIRRNAPVGMHPGPVVLPVGLAPGAEATAPITWIQGPVFTRNSCFDARTATVTIAGTAMGLAFGAHLCGENGRAGFNQPPLRTDPTL